MRLKCIKHIIVRHLSFVTTSVLPVDLIVFIGIDEMDTFDRWNVMIHSLLNRQNINDMNLYYIRLGRCKSYFIFIIEPIHKQFCQWGNLVNIVALHSLLLMFTTFTYWTLFLIQIKDQIELTMCVFEGQEDLTE